MFRRIRRRELNELASEWDFSIEDDQLDEFHLLTEYVADATDGVVDLPQPAPDRLPGFRDPGRSPGEGEDPYNAVVRWCSARLEGAEGPLSGKRLGLKDAIAVAGVPLTAGSNVLRDFIPTTDSTVTRRILDAGGEIVAMLNMDYMAFSGGGDSSAYGPTLCPFDTSRTAGGSSSGSAAALHYSEIDLTMGCDQGGSIRLPAAWSGVIGLKPTHGLVPYTGILGVDQGIDHTGPMARTAMDAARLLQVVAGPDEDDPRQPAGIPELDYMSAVERAADSLGGVRFGVLEEGFAEDIGVEVETGDAVRGAIEQFAELGAEIREVSIPEHLRAGPVAFTLYMEGMTALMSAGGNGHQWRGKYWPELAWALAAGLRTYGDDLADQVKLALICGTHMQRRYRGATYAMARNQIPWLRAAYDQVLSEVDILLLPTAPIRPHKIDPNLSISERVMRGWAILANTGPMNITGHPAITLPVAEAEGLPVGAMLVGRAFEDDKLLSVARTFEQAYGWKPGIPSSQTVPPRPSLT
jgi:amidase